MEKVDPRVERIVNKFKGFCEGIGGKFHLNDYYSDYDLICELPERKRLMIGTEEGWGLTIRSDGPFKFVEFDEEELPESRTLRGYGRIHEAIGKVGSTKSTFIHGEGTDICVRVSKDFTYMNIIIR